MPEVSARKGSKSHFNHRSHESGVMQKPLVAKAVAGGEGLWVICVAPSLWSTRAPPRPQPRPNSGATMRLSRVFNYPIGSSTSSQPVSPPQFFVTIYHFCHNSICARILGFVFIYNISVLTPTRVPVCNYVQSFATGPLRPPSSPSTHLRIFFWQSLIHTFFDHIWSAIILYFSDLLYIFKIISGLCVVPTKLQSKN